MNSGARFGVVLAVWYFCLLFIVKPPEKSLGSKLASKCRLSVVCRHNLVRAEPFCLKTHTLHILRVYALGHDSLSRIKMWSMWPWPCQISNFILSDADFFCLLSHINFILSAYVLRLESVEYKHEVTLILNIKVK